MISRNKFKLIRSLEQRKVRKECGLFVGEGHKLVEDFLPVFDCVFLAATSGWLAAKGDWLGNVLGDGVELHVVSEDELRRLSLQKHPQDVLAVFRRPLHWDVCPRLSADVLCLALDGVQDPGNLGTIVRVADWFGIEHIYCSQTTVDVFGPKAVQATMGALARVGVHYVSLSDLIGGAEPGLVVYGTFLDGVNIYDEGLSVGGLIVMGNEGNGICAEVEGLVNKRLLIPNFPNGRATTESLNVAVAAAVVCAEFRRRVSRT